MPEIIEIEQPLTDIEIRRATVAELLVRKSQNIKSPRLAAISTADLRLLYELYDEVFLQGWFKNNYKGRIKFSFSRMMTKSAGKTICPKNIGKIKPEDLVVEIRIGIDFFLNYGQLSMRNTVCGLKADSGLEALMLVFEHELCHVVEFILYHNSSCAGERFKSMSKNLFGHTESWHKLPTNRQIADKVLGFRIGDTVSFKFKDKKLTGIIYNVRKRATVLVPDSKGMFMDRSGKMYSKYYIPLRLLARVN